jgi:hypothetical protein
VAAADGGHVAVAQFAGGGEVFDDQGFHVGSPCIGELVERAFDVRSPGYEQNACQAKKPVKPGVPAVWEEKMAGADQHHADSVGSIRTPDPQAQKNRPAGGPGGVLIV